MVGMDVPLLPLAHQYVKTGQVAELVGRNDEASEIGMPILRHQDADLYFREHVDRIGIGSYAHRPMPVRLDDLEDDGEVDRLRHAVDAALHRGRLRRPLGAVPRAAAGTARGEGRGGLQRDLLLHPRRRAADRGVPGRRRLLDRRGRVGDPLGRRRQGRRRSCWWTAGPSTTCTAATCTASRSSSAPPDYVEETSAQNFVEIYDVLHPLQPKESPRNLRVSPFHRRQERARRGLPRGRRLGAPALVRGERRPAGRPARRVDAAAARRLVRAVPLADRGGGGVAHPRGRSRCTT